MRHVVLAVAVLAVAAACGPRASTGEDGEEDGVAPLLASVQATDLGDRVRFVLQVTNTTESPVELTFPTGQSFDFVVLDEGGTEVWRWSADQMFTQAIRTERVAPGETLTYTAEWTPPPQAEGTYRVVGRLAARDVEVSQRATFRLDAT